MEATLEWSISIGIGVAGRTVERDQGRTYGSHLGK